MQIFKSKCFHCGDNRMILISALEVHRKMSMYTGGL